MFHFPAVGLGGGLTETKINEAQLCLFTKLNRVGL